MRRILLLFPVAVVAAAAFQWLAVSVDAHHSEAPFYDGDRTVNIRGVVKSWVFRNPHPFLYVEVEEGDGSVARWVLEGAGATQFAQQGINKDVFKIGDPVQVIANPSRSPNSTRGRLIKITRTTDGKSWGTRVGEVVD